MGDKPRSANYHVLGDLPAETTHLSNLITHCTERYNSALYTLIIRGQHGLYIWYVGPLPAQCS